MKKVIRNARIYTLDSKNTVCDTLVMEDGKILTVGNEAELSMEFETGCQIVDMGGKTVLPAFHDSHMHLLGYSRFLGMVDLYQTGSLKLLQQKIKSFIEENHMLAGEWVRGRGWNQDYFDVVEIPTKKDLDKISTEHPIVITRACGHMMVVNSKALEICGIDGKLDQIDPKEIEFGEDGKPNGIFKEGSMDFIYGCIPEATVEELKLAVLKGQEKLFEQGITAVQSDDFGSGSSYEEVIRAFRELEQEGRLKVKVYEQCNFGTLDVLKDFFEKGYGVGGANHGEEDIHYRLGPLKILGDGSLGARTAWMRNGYADAPEVTGIVYFEKEELYEYMKYAHDRDMDIAIHGIGDGMIAYAVDCFERLQRENPKQDIRHGIVHCQITDADLLDRIAKNKILVYMQPIFLNYDLHIVEARVGKELAATSYNWRTLWDKGVHLSTGSDCPVESFDTMNNIYSAVTRKDLKGCPEQGYLPEQKLSIEEAIISFTKESAYAAKKEARQGTLEPGKYADLVVLDQDIYECESDKVKDIKICMTIADGEVVYTS